MKVLLIGGAFAAIIVVGVLAVAHGIKVCRAATVFMEHH
jgi:hypothetical protein